MARKKSTKSAQRSGKQSASTDRAVGTKDNGAPNQGVRVVMILKMLHDAPKGLSVNEIMAKLFSKHSAEIDRRQINRDLKFIGEAGIGLEVERIGKTPVYKIPANERVLSLKSIQEGAQLVTQLLKDILPQSSKIDVDGMVDQIANIVRNEGDIQTLGSAKLMHSVHAGTWQREVNAGILSESFAAVAKKKLVFIRYGSSVGKQQHVLPCTIVMYLGRLYLIVFEAKKNDYFVFAIDRIHEIRPDPKSRVHQHEFDEKKFMKTRFGIWSTIKNDENPSGTYKVVVDVLAEDDKPHLLNEFVDRVWHPTQQKKVINDKTVRLTFTCGVSPELVSWVLRWAPHVRVVEPEFLKDKVRERAKALMEML
ncbi:MAG: WYL domain-containing protein [Candidatus Kapabacteria bacterium]|nr:WYL domain-containing protein [Candidatus Kapabacteria bacterium]